MVASLNPVRARGTPAFTGFAHQALWSLGDQGLISAMNFLTMVLLARSATKESFGEFVLVYTGLLFANALLSSLVTQPHNVLGISRYSGSYQSYTSTCALAQLTFSLLAAGLVAGAGLASYLNGWGITTLLVLLAPTVLAWQTQEFFRRVMYTDGTPRRAFLNDVVSYGGQGLGTVLLWRAGRLDGPAVLAMIAVTSAAAAFLGAYQLRAHFTWRLDLAYLKGNWTFGSWLAGASVASWLSTQAYRIMIAIVLGTPATALVAATETSMRPLGVVAISLQSVLPSRFARVLAGGRDVRSEIAKVAVVTLPLMLGYSFFMLGLGEKVIDLMYGGKYRDTQLLLFLFACYYGLFYANIIISSLLMATHATDITFWISAMSALATVALGWVFLELLGIEGALTSMIVIGVFRSIIVLRSRKVQHALSSFASHGPVRQTSQAV